MWVRCASATYSKKRFNTERNKIWPLKTRWTLPGMFFVIYCCTSNEEKGTCFIERKRGVRWLPGNCSNNRLDAISESTFNRVGEGLNWSNNAGYSICKILSQIKRRWATSRTRRLAARRAQSWGVRNGSSYTNRDDGSMKRHKKTGKYAKIRYTLHYQVHIYLKRASISTAGMTSKQTYLRTQHIRTGKYAKHCIGWCSSLA